MRKIYMNPTMDVVNIHFNHALLAGSHDGMNVIDVTTEEITDPGSVAGRELDFEEEEFSMEEEEF
jgi:hypothetical protein